MQTSYGRQEFPAPGAPAYDQAGNPRWRKGDEPEYGIAAGMRQMGRDELEHKPAMKVFPGSRQGELSFDGQGTQPIWMTELQGAYVPPSSRMGTASSEVSAAGGRMMTQGSKVVVAEDPARGMRMFPERASGGDGNVLGATDAPLQHRGSDSTPQPSPSGSGDRHLDNFQSQLQEDIYQRYRHIKDAFLAMDPDRLGLVDRAAVVKLCQVANLGEASAGELIDAFDRSGTTVWDFNEFVAALRKKDYDDPLEQRRGVAGIGPVPEHKEQKPDGWDTKPGVIRTVDLIAPTERMRSKIPVDLRGVPIEPKKKREFVGAGMRVEHAAPYEHPQLRARIMTKAFEKMDRQQMGRVPAGAIIEWAQGLPRAEDVDPQRAHVLKLEFDTAFEKTMKLCERQPDQRLPLHDIARMFEHVPISLLGGEEAALDSRPATPEGTVSPRSTRGRSNQSGRGFPSGAASSGGMAPTKSMVSSGIGMQRSGGSGSSSARGARFGRRAG